MGAVSKIVTVARYLMGIIGRDTALLARIQGVVSPNGASSVNIYPRYISSVRGEIYEQLSNHFGDRRMYVHRGFEERQGKSVVVTIRRDDPQIWPNKDFWPYVEGGILKKGAPDCSNAPFRLNTNTKMNQRRNDDSEQR